MKNATRYQKKNSVVDAHFLTIDAHLMTIDAHLISVNANFIVVLDSGLRLYKPFAYRIDGEF